MSLTDKEKARQRFFASVDEVDDYIPQCAVCKNVDGKNCKALKGIRPEKYYMDDHPDFQKCPHFNFNPKAHTADIFLELSKNYEW